jgi:hypothetical protein
MACGPKGCAEPSPLQCAVCGRRTELFELPGRRDKYCLECSADVATSILLTTEIDAATISGEGNRRLGGGICTVEETAIGESAVGIEILADNLALVLQIRQSETIHPDRP